MCFISNVVTKHVDLRGGIFVEETTPISCPRQLMCFISNVVTKHVDLPGGIFVEETTPISCPYMGEKNGNPDEKANKQT